MFKFSQSAVLWRLLGVFAVAVIFRVVFFHGFFPSDQYSYSLDAARLISEDTRLKSEYIGSTRWGIILPTAFFYQLFGINDVSSALWAMLCSLGTVFLAYRLGKKFKDESTGLLAGLLVAVFPLEIIYSGQLMGDTPMSFWLLLTLYGLWSSGKSKTLRQRRFYFLLSGFGFGMAYATKDVVVVLLPLCMVFPFLIHRQRLRELLWFIFGFSVILCFEYIFFYAMTGNAFHRHEVLFDNRTTRTIEAVIGTSLQEHAIGKYFFWLLVDVHKVGGAFIALTAIIVAQIIQHRRHRQGSFTYWPLLCWSGAILLVLSFFPLSLRPYHAIYKQPNYMLMFTAPGLIALALVLEQLSRRGRTIIVGLIILSNLPAAYISLESNRAHVDNSCQIYKFYQAHRDRPLYASGYNLVYLEYMEDFKNTERYKDFTASTPWRLSAAAAPTLDFSASYVAIDQYFLDFYANNFGHKFPPEILNPPANWQPVLRYQRQPKALQRIFCHLLDALYEKRWLRDDWHSHLSRKIVNWSHTKPVIIYDTAEHAPAKQQ